MTLPSIEAHTNAVISTLEGFGLIVGDAEAPANKEELLAQGKGYVVVYQVPGGTSSGNLDNPSADAVYIYQVTCVGTRRVQADWLADKVSGLLQANLSVPGRYIPTIKVNMHGGARRDDTVTPPVFLSTPRFRIASTPDGEES